MMNDNTVIFGFFFSVIVALLPSCGGSGTEGDPLADCGKLGIAYGSVFTNKTTVGGKATYTCDDGYELNGKVMRTCGAFGNWSGEAPTCEDIDECASNNGGCDRNATCTNNARFAATCVCKDGYTGDGMTCSDVDECLLDNGGCHLNATCTNTTGSRTCACKNGYSGDGENCYCKLELVTQISRKASGFIHGEVQKNQVHGSGLKLCCRFKCFFLCCSLHILTIRYLK